MKTSAFISRLESSHPSLDFKSLKDKGIREIQKVGGEEWTDYNIHDPGVTILEQLCYALTELGFQANFDIKHLLASQEGQERVKDTFFTPAEILTCNALTTEDFRKLLIDRVWGLRDVWVKPLNLTHEHRQVRGTYLVLAETSPSVIHTQDDEDRMKADLEQCLQEHSNLTEAFEEIIILERQEVYVDATIEIEDKADVNLIHAQVLFNLDRQITKPLPFYDLKTMLGEGYEINDLFDGPRLINGFVKEQDLKEKTTFLDASKLIKSLTHIEGINKVMELRTKAMHDDGSFRFGQSRLTNKEITDGLLIDMNKVALLGRKMLPESAEGYQLIKYFKNGIPVQPFPREVIRHFRRLETDAMAVYFTAFQSSMDFEVQLGQPFDLGSYHSIQHQFPANYALGERGLPSNASQERKSWVKQLKAYLLFFEQILSGYFAQIEHFTALYSLDEDLRQTYFADDLASVPGIEDLFFTIDDDDGAAEFNEQVKRIGNQVLQKIDRFHERRHRFLDHLLARFGESVSNYGIDRFNYYYSKETHQRNLISSKIQLLEKIDKLSGNRAQSFDQTQEYWGFNNISFIEQKVKIQLGFPLNSNMLWNQTFDHIKIVKNEAFDFGDRFNNSDEEEFYIEKKSLSNVEESKSKAAESPYERSKAKRILKDVYVDSDVFRRAIWRDNLRIMVDRNDEGMRYLLLFSKKLTDRAFDDSEIAMLTGISELLSEHDDKNLVRLWWESGKDEKFLLEFEKGANLQFTPHPVKVWQVLTSCSSRRQAMKKAKYLATYLSELNRDSEGFYLIDHILLRSMSENNLYGVQFKDRTGTINFMSANQFPYARIQEEVIQLVLNLRQARKEVKPHNKGYRLSLMHEGKELGHTFEEFASPELAENHFKAHLEPYLQAFSEFDLHDLDKIKFFKQNDPRHDIDGDDLSFRLTVVAPKWPARFGDPEFIQTFEQAFRMATPAHVGIDFLYLDFDEMKYFENDYDRWLIALRRKENKTNNKSLNRASMAIYQWLVRYGMTRSTAPSTA